MKPQWDESKCRRNNRGQFTHQTLTFKARKITTSHEGRAMVARRWKKYGLKTDRKNVMRRRWYARKKQQELQEEVEAIRDKEAFLYFVNEHPTQKRARKKTDWSKMGKRST